MAFLNVLSLFSPELPLQDHITSLGISIISQSVEGKAVSESQLIPVLGQREWFLCGKEQYKQKILMHKVPGHKVFPLAFLSGWAPLPFFLLSGLTPQFFPHFPS